MVYIENTTIEQEVWIERNDGLGAIHKSSYQEGYEDGYASGETHQKNLLTTTAFTENGEYQRENGWSGVTVDVPQTGHTDQELEDAFENGYTSGQTDQKNLLTTTAFTENGSYQRENGWSGVTVNIDTASTYNSGYTSGYTDGQGSLSSVTFTANTAVTVSDGGYSAITVNVPQTGTTVKLEEKSVTISADTTNIIPTPGFDGMSAVTVDASEYAQTNYDNGFDDGFEDGYSSGSTDEKAKLSGITFTANTAVTLSDGGYSAVTVNVAQTGTSATLEEKDVVVTGVSMTVNPSQGFDGMSKVNLDALGLTGQYWQSGHTQGIEDQKMLLSSAEFSANGVYNRANGWDRVTVNVPQTGSSIPLSSITLTANTAISVSDKAYTGITVNVDTASTYNDGYNDARNDVEDGAQTLSVSANGTYNTGLMTEGYLWHEVIVDVPQTGSSSVLGTKTITENGTYSASTDSLDGYSAVTVNVPQGSPGVKYVEYLETDGSEISWDTGVKLEDPNEIVYFDFAPLTGTATGDAYFPFLSQQYEDYRWNLAIRTIGMGYNVNDYMQTIYGDGRQFIAYSVGNKNVCVISLTGATVNGVDYHQQATGLYTVDWNIIINGQKKSDGFMRFPVGRYYGFKIMSGNNAVIDLKPALDGNDVPCFFDEVSKTYIYHIGSGTPISGPAIPSSDYISGFTDGYASGFTDGYNSGYTDGQDSIISTFTSMTATTNGIYGSSAHPLSSITVDVQTVDYGELIGLYCTNNCQFVITPGSSNNLNETMIYFGINSGDVSMKITSGASLPYANRIVVDNNGNVTGNSYSYSSGSGVSSTGSGTTNVVLNAFPTKNTMYINAIGPDTTTKVNGLSASTCTLYSTTPAYNMLLSIDDGYFYGIGYFNSRHSSDTAACLYPHVDTDGNACIRGHSNLFYPISGECYPIYKNGNNYYVLMKTQPWNQQ